MPTAYPRYAPHSLHIHRGICSGGNGTAKTDPPPVSLISLLFRHCIDLFCRLFYRFIDSFALCRGFVIGSYSRCSRRAGYIVVPKHIEEEDQQRQKQRPKDNAPEAKERYPKDYPKDGNKRMYVGKLFLQQ